MSGPVTPPRRSPVPRFLGEASGATAVEFGLLALPSLSTIVVILGLGLNALFTASLDRAVLLTARAIATGTVSSSAMSVSALKTNVVCPALLAAMNCNNVFINVETLSPGRFPSTYYSMVMSNQSGLIQPALNSSNNTFCPGSGAQYVVVELAYPAPIFAASLVGSTTATYNGSPVNVILATATFLSEPYSGAATYAGC